MARSTLKSVADHLGLAPGTVSRALNDYPDISPDTKERVRSAALELGYNPNRTARSLAKGVNETVSYVLPSGEGALSEPFLGEFLRGVGEAVSSFGWEFSLAIARSPEHELELIDELSRSGRTGGMVLSRTLSDDPRIDMLRRSGIPFVAHGRTRDCADYAWYDVDGELASMDAVRHLASLGHERIAYLAGPDRYNFARLRREGFALAMREVLGREPEPDLAGTCELNVGAGEALAARVLRHGPTALVCVTDTVAIGAIAALAKRGLEPGRDVSVIGYDGIEFGAHTSPPLTTMAQPKARAGQRIGEILVKLIGGADARDLHELHRARLVRRRTDGPPR